MVEILRDFVHDWQVQAVAILIALDFVLGVSEALVNKKFRLSYISDFMQNDVLKKMVPFYAVYLATAVGGDIDLGPINAVVDGTWVAVSGALTASVLNSLAKLRDEAQPAGDSIIGSDPNTPVS